MDTDLRLQSIELDRAAEAAQLQRASPKPERSGPSTRPSGYPRAST